MKTPRADQNPPPENRASDPAEASAARSHHRQKTRLPNNRNLLPPFPAPNLHSRHLTIRPFVVRNWSFKIPSRSSLEILHSKFHGSYCLKILTLLQPSSLRLSRLCGSISSPSPFTHLA